MSPRVALLTLVAFKRGSVEAFASPLMYLLILSGEAMTKYEILSGRSPVPANK